ncbi:MAG TPA: flippase [Solirubrobacteraceae bacterium]|jgi:O-antigen/teichoic acid export membrane protein|nr:flippase [Solirubrobacteraceae bacterium]
MPIDQDQSAGVEPEPDMLDTPSAGPAAIRGSSLRTIGYVIGVGLSVVSAPLLIRHLGPVGYGRYVRVIALVTIVQGVTDVGLGQIGAREFAARAPSERPALMRNLLGVRVVLTSIGVLLAGGFSAVAYGHTVLLGTLLAGIGMVLTVLQGTFAVPLAASLRLGWVSVLELLRQVLTVAGIVTLVLAGAKLLSFLALTIPVAVAVLAVTLLVVHASTPLRPSFQRREWAPLLRAVLPFAVASAIGTVYLRITVVLMSLLTGELQSGYYAISYTVISVLIAVPALTVGSTLPILARAARDDHERLAYVLKRLFEVTLIVGVWLGIVFVLGAGFVVGVLTNSRSPTAVEVLQIQSVAILTQFLATTWQYGLLSLHRHRDLLYISVVSLTASVCLTFALVPLLQARGAAIAFSGAELMLAASSLLLLRRARSKFDLDRRVPSRVLCATVLAFAAAYPLDVSSLARAIVGSAVYLAALLALRAIPQEITQALRRRTQPAGG